MEHLFEHKKTESDYFEAELKYLIEGGKEFAKKHPSTASNLKLTQNGSEDPHVQQILESFAFLTGNLQKQIDQSSQILSKSLLENLYPNLVLPIPCMSVAEFKVNSSHPALLKGVAVPRGSLLVHDSAHEVTYKFKTVYDTLLFPGDVQSVKIENALNYDFIKDKNKKLISIEMELFSEKINIDNVKNIRFYIDAGKANSNKIFDIIFNESTEIYIHSHSNKHQKLTKENISKVGFNQDESLIYPDKKNPETFKTFQEYFLFQEKFLFFDIKDLDFEKVGRKFTLIFSCAYFAEQKFSIDKSCFKTRCTPIINLFPVMSEPIVTEEIKKTYKLYTNYLKNKFLYFHSIDRLKYIDEENSTHEIIHVLNYPFYMYKKEKHYFYDFTLNEKEPNCFEISLHSDNKKIFIDKTTIYSDIFVTNGYLCEKLKEGVELNSAENYPINKCVLLKSPSKYLEGVNDSNFYWKVISYLYNEKLTFSDLNEFVRDLKSIININLEILSEKERGYLILNSIEEVKIQEKSFKIKKNNSFSFIKGKEINLFINSTNIVNESIAIFAECIFSFLQNICPLNLCLSLVIIDNHSKRILYTCSAKAGVKKEI